jgi:putative ABC transport system permease protein
MAKRYWPGGGAVGQQLRLDSKSPPVQIVGVARDITYYRVGEAPRPFFYLPFGPITMNGLTFQLRTRGPDDTLPQLLRRELRASDPRIRVPLAMTFDAARQLPLYPSRTMATISATFGVLALVLTLVGLYGVVMYAVSERTREFALRMALGARPGDILRGVVRRGVATAAVGVALGAAAAMGLARLLAGFLVGVSPVDPLTIAGWSLVLLVLAAAASYWPARRATKIDPAAALSGRS